MYFLLIAPIVLFVLMTIFLALKLFRLSKNPEQKKFTLRVLQKAVPILSIFLPIGLVITAILTSIFSLNFVQYALFICGVPFPTIALIVIARESAKLKKEIDEFLRNN